MSSSDASTEEKAIQYLEEKYDKEFEAMWSKEGSKLFQDLYGGDLVTVHPKGEKNVVFSVKEGNEEGDLIDNYIPAKWGNELHQKLEDDIAKELPEGTLFKVNLSVGNDRFDDSMANMSVDEYLSQHKDARVDLIAGVQTSAAPNVEQYQEGIYNLFHLIKNVGVSHYTISVGFVDESEDISEYIQTSFVNNLPWSNLKGKVYGEVNVDERLDPENPSDLVDPSVILHSPSNVIENYEAFEE